MRRLGIIGPIIFLLSLAASPVAGQIAWDAPPLVSHVAPSGVSLFLLSPAGGDLGGLVTFRHSAGPVGLGYRFALSDESGTNDLAAAAGVDVSGFLGRAVEGSEVDVLWWSGAGLGVGAETVASFPLGALVGWSGAGGEALLSPYGGGHVVFDIRTGDGDQLDLDGAFDFGLDVALTSGWLIRFGASLGDREALAIGAHIGT